MLKTEELSLYDIPFALDSRDDHGGLDIVAKLVVNWDMASDTTIEKVADSSVELLRVIL